MVTELGKFLRKLRIEKGELLYDMAQTLGVSSAFLSKVENGKKKPPMKWKEIIAQKYNLTEGELHEFSEKFFDAVNTDSIDLSWYQEDDRELMLSFAREFNPLDKRAIKKMLKK